MIQPRNDARNEFVGCPYRSPSRSIRRSPDQSPSESFIRSPPFRVLRAQGPWVSGRPTVESGLRWQQDGGPQCKLLRAPVLPLGPFPFGITCTRGLFHDQPLLQGQASLAAHHSSGIAPELRDEARSAPCRSSHAHATASRCNGLGAQDASRCKGLGGEEASCTSPAVHVRFATAALRAATPVQGEDGGGWLPRYVGHSAATVLMRHFYLFRFYLVDHPATRFLSFPFGIWVVCVKFTFSVAVAAGRRFVWPCNR